MKKMGVFISTAETGSFTNGARRCNISQPAAVSIINEIESTIGAELFVRTGKTRRAKLTPKGEEVYDTLVRVLSIYNQALDAISDGNRKRKVQTVLIQKPYTAAISSSWLRSLMASCTDRTLSIRSAEWHQIITAIENRDECMALMDGDVRPKNNEYFSLGTIEMIFAAPLSSSYCDLETDRIAWEDVPKETLIYSAVSPTTIERIYENLKMSGAIKEDFIEVDCANILRNFINEIGAPVIMPRIMIDTLQCARGLRCLEFAHSKVHVSLGLSLPYGHHMRLKMAGRDLQQVLRPTYLS